MKRLVLWATSIAVMMILSATSALAAHTTLEALSLAELDAVTAGICETCKKDDPPPPPPKPLPTPAGTSWEIYNTRTSTPVVQNRKAIGHYPNSTSVASTIRLTYNDACRHVLVSGGINIAKSLGMTIGTIYHCDEIREHTFTVAPYRSVTVYSGEMVEYTTYSSREVLHWSDGGREFTGRTETARIEHRYKFLEPVEAR